MCHVLIACSPAPRLDSCHRMPRYRVTVDTGGTFSDFVYLDEKTGEVSIAKIPSTPDDPAGAERRGPATGLLVTEVFSGIYPVGEQARPYGTAIFDVMYDKPPALVPLRPTGTVKEPVASRGQVS